MKNTLTFLVFVFVLNSAAAVFTTYKLSNRLTLPTIGITICVGFMGLIQAIEKNKK